MPSSPLKPLVGVVCDIRDFDAHAYHAVGDKYLLALIQAADVVPVLIPALAKACDTAQWLSRIDGVFLPGAYSMVDPVYYGEQPIDRPYDYDPRRDTQSIALIRGAKALDKPLFGACRGMQDINVALGGSLYQAVQDQPGMMDHREIVGAALDVQYGLVHTVDLVEGGMLHSLVGSNVITVNSLHSQGIHRLAEPLQIEATAGDGLIEAVSVKGMRFGLGVQWHPEWRVTENNSQKLIFEAFGRACRTPATTE